MLQSSMLERVHKLSKERDTFPQLCCCAYLENVKCHRHHLSSRRQRVTWHNNSSPDSAQGTRSGRCGSLFVSGREPSLLVHEVVCSSTYDRHQYCEDGHT